MTCSRALRQVILTSKILSNRTTRSSYKSPQVTLRLKEAEDGQEKYLWNHSSLIWVWMAQRRMIMEFQKSMSYVAGSAKKLLANDSQQKQAIRPRRRPRKKALQNVSMKREKTTWWKKVKISTTWGSLQQLFTYQQENRLSFKCYRICSTMKL